MTDSSCSKKPVEAGDEAPWSFICSIFCADFEELFVALDDLIDELLPFLGPELIDALFLFLGPGDLLKFEAVDDLVGLPMFVKRIRFVLLLLRRRRRLLFVKVIHSVLRQRQFAFVKGSHSLLVLVLMLLLRRLRRAMVVGRLVSAERVVVVERMDQLAAVGRGRLVCHGRVRRRFSRGRVHVHVRRRRRRRGGGRPRPVQSSLTTWHFECLFKSFSELRFFFW